MAAAAVGEGGAPRAMLKGWAAGMVVPDPRLGGTGRFFNLLL